MKKIPDIQLEFINLIQAAIVEIIADILHIDPEKIIIDESYARNGIDSIIGIEIITRLNNKFNLALHEIDLYSYPNIGSLAAFLAGSYNDTFVHLLNKEQAQQLYKKNKKNKVSAKNSLKKPQTKQQANITDVAIIGMSGRFPGAETLDEFWENLVCERNAIREIPAERWNLDIYFDPDPHKPGKSYSKWGGYLKDIDMFDAAFFKISPREAELSDPQQRLFMEEAWKALEDAGYAKNAESSKCGVYVGVSEGDYRNKLESSIVDSDQFLIMIGNTLSILPARVSYFLNLKGAALAIDTACSSSLVALHIARLSIINSENDLAISGGVQALVTPRYYLYASRGGMFSPDGQCRAFDNDANGFVYSEGVGAVVLKSLEQAIADRDMIYGIIKGSGTNQDGKTNGITAPSSESQTALEIEVYTRSTINPESLDYIEAHGTGTKLGDPIEVEALTKAFRRFTDKKNFCRIGSVKTNIGHPQVAAGIAGVIKILLSLKHEKIPASINFNKANKLIDFAKSPFIVNTELSDWQRTAQRPRRAAISAFGFSGTNCHMIIEEAPIVEPRKTLPEFPGHIAIFSARSLFSLEHYLVDMNRWLDLSRTEYNIADVCYTLNAKKTHFNYRIVLIVESCDDMRKQLAFINNYIAHNENWYDHYQKLVSFDSRYLRRLSKDFMNRFKLSNVTTKEEYIELLFQLALSCKTGMEINWNTFYAHDNFMTIALPMYHFNRKKFWIPEDESNKPVLVNNHYSGGLHLSAIHPLIDSNTSTFEQMSFTKVFTGNEFYLRDHVIGNELILPGAVYIEMIHAAGDSVFKNKKVSSIQNISWLIPVIVKNNPLQVVINLHYKDNVVLFSLQSGNENEKIIHSQAIIKYIDKYENKAEAFKKIYKIEEIKKRCNFHLEKNEIYQQFNQRDAHFGETFQSIAEFNYNAEEAIAKLQLHDIAKNGTEHFFLSPVIMDGAIQTGALLRYVSHNDDYLLPFNLASIDIYNRLGNECYVYCKSLAGKGIKTWRCDVSILNSNGELLVQLNDLLFRDLSNVSVRGSSHNKTSLLYYYPVFKKNKKNTLNGNKFYGNNILLFDVNCELFDYIRDSGDSPENMVLVKPGKTFAIESDIHYYANPEKKSDIVNIFKNIGFIPDHVIFMWSKHIQQNEPGNVIENMNYSVIPLFHIITQLAENKWNSRVVLFYNGEHEHNKHFFNALLGFSKVIEHELSRIFFKIVELTTDILSDCSKLYTVIAQEQDKADLFASYKEGDRYTIYYEKLAELEEKSENTLFKDNGVYIITGGMGGLGKIFASYIASRVKARIALIGRSVPDQTKMEYLTELRALGSEAEYFSADITNKDAVKLVIKDIKKSYGPITGVIHAAGILNDALFYNKTIEDFLAVAAPKIWGTLYLDEYTALEKLDFFVLFSSTSSIFGNQGQSDYAYANSFMDYYVNYRTKLVALAKRSGFSLAINWPLWKDGGMKPSHDVEISMRQKYGLEKITSKIGCEAFEKIVQLKKPQVIALHGDELKLQKAINRVEIDHGKAKKESLIDDEINKQKMLEIIKNYLTNEISQILKIDRDELLYDEELTDYGFDSVTLTELTNKLNEIFNLELTASILFEYSTIEQAAKYIIDNFEKNMVNYFDNNMIKNVLMTSEINKIQESEEAVKNENEPGNMHTVELLKKLASGQMTIKEIKDLL